jgi:hypothetical protein
MNILDQSHNTSCEVREFSEIEARQSSFSTFSIAPVIRDLASVKT